MTQDVTTTSLEILADLRKLAADMCAERDHSIDWRDLQIVIGSDTDKILAAGLESSLVPGRRVLSSVVGGKLWGMEVVIDNQTPNSWGVRVRRADEATPVSEPNAWVVEACTAPGVRELIWLGPAINAAEAFKRAHANGNTFTAYLAKPNYIATGKSNPVVWED